MAAPQPLTMGDYCKQTDEGHVSRGFVMADPTNFDTKNYVLSCLLDNSFDVNSIRDLWAHLACFYETASICKPDGVSDYQIKLQLFGFLLIGRAKDWLLCLPNATIRTWKELEDKFLQRFFTTSQFTERRTEIFNFEQQDIESLHDSWERFKLLLRRCPNHNMNNMEQMQIFIKGLDSQTCMLLDTSAGGTIIQMTKPQVKYLIENMCRNEYRSKSKRSVKLETSGTPKGMLNVDTHSRTRTRKN